jgi:hypothetical protein
MVHRHGRSSSTPPRSRWRRRGPSCLFALALFFPLQNLSRPRQLEAAGHIFFRPRTDDSRRFQILPPVSFRLINHLVFLKNGPQLFSALRPKFCPLSRHSIAHCDPLNGRRRGKEEDHRAGRLACHPGTAKLLSRQSRQAINDILLEPAFFPNRIACVKEFA